MNRNYEVKINSTRGTCDSPLFKKMAMKGDITSTKIDEVVDKVVSITGIAECHINANGKEFDINYFATKEYGFIATGSNIFLESVIEYMEDVDFIKIQKVKTKKGITYKAVPILVDSVAEEVA